MTRDRPGPTDGGYPHGQVRQSEETAMTDDRGNTGAVELEEMGPIDYVVIEFPAGYPTGQHLPLLMDLVDRGLIRIFDIALVKREFDGSMSLLALADADGDGEWDYSVFEG